MRTPSINSSTSKVASLFNQTRYDYSDQEPSCAPFGKLVIGPGKSGYARPSSRLCTSLGRQGMEGRSFCTCVLTMIQRPSSILFAVLHSMDPRLPFDEIQE